MALQVSPYCLFDTHTETEPALTVNLPQPSPSTATSLSSFCRKSGKFPHFQPWPINNRDVHYPTGAAPSRSWEGHQVYRRIYRDRTQHGKYLARFAALRVTPDELGRMDDAEMHRYFLVPEKTAPPKKPLSELGEMLPELAAMLKKRGVTKQMVYAKYAAQCPPVATVRWIL